MRDVNIPNEILKVLEPTPFDITMAKLYPRLWATSQVLYDGTVTSIVSRYREYCASIRRQLPLWVNDPVIVGGLLNQMMHAHEAAVSYLMDACVAHAKVRSGMFTGRVEDDDSPPVTPAELGIPG